MEKKIGFTIATREHHLRGLNEMKKSTRRMKMIIFFMA